MEAQTILREDIVKLRSDTGAVVDDLNTILDDTAGLADEQLAALRKTAEQRIRRALARLQDVGEGLEARVERAVHRSENLVAKHPWQAAAEASLAAGAIGASLWFLLRQR